MRLSDLHRAKTFASFLCVLVLCACNGKKDTLPNEEYEDFSIEELVRDSIEGEQVSEECAIVCHNIDKVAEEVAAVKSPESLIAEKQTYSNDLKKAESGKSELSDEEQKVADKHVQEAKEAYLKACRENEVPSSGVIANLKNMSKKLDNVKSYDDLRKFEEFRLGVLQNLDNLYLCIEQGDKGVKEVKSLSQVVKSKWEGKKRQFGK